MVRFSAGVHMAVVAVAAGANFNTTFSSLFTTFPNIVGFWVRQKCKLVENRIALVVLVMQHNNTLVFENTVRLGEIRPEEAIDITEGNVECVNLLHLSAYYSFRYSPLCPRSPPFQDPRG